MATNPPAATYENALKDTITERSGVTTPEGTAQELCSLLASATNERVPISKKLQEEIMQLSEGLFESDSLSFERACLLYNHLYFMKWQAASRLSDLSGFNEQAVEPFSSYLKRRSNRHPLQSSRQRQKGSPIRLAYLNASISINTGDAIARVTTSMIKGHKELSSKDFHVFLIATEDPDVIYLRHLEDLGVEVLIPPFASFQERLTWILEQGRTLELDVIVTDNNLALSTALFMERAAPLQMFMEMGFPHWNIPELDHLLLGISPIIDNPAPGRPLHRTARPIAIDFHAPHRPRSEILSFRNRFEPDQVVVGFYGRLIKLSPEYLEMLNLLLEAEPRCAIYLGGVGEPELVNTFINASPHRDRIHFDHGFVDGHLVGYGLDIFLDSFPFHGGNSVLEVLAKGVPTIWMPQDTDEPVYLTDTMRDPALAGSDTVAYIKKTRELIQNGALRAKCSETAKKLALAASDCASAARQVEEIIRKSFNSESTQALL